MQSTIKRLIKYWADNAVLADEEVNVSGLQSIGINLPSDFIEFYNYVDGMSDWDSNGFYFLPLHELKSAAPDDKFGSIHPLADIVIFADYMQNSWEYGVRMDSNGAYQIGILPFENQFIVITNSLENFLELYIQDSNKFTSFKINVLPARTFQPQLLRQ